MRKHQLINSTSDVNLPMDLVLFLTWAIATILRGNNELFFNLTIFYSCMLTKVRNFPR